MSATGPDEVEKVILDNADAFGRLTIRGETNEGDLAVEIDTGEDS